MIDVDVRLHDGVVLISVEGQTFSVPKGLVGLLMEKLRAVSDKKRYEIKTDVQFVVAAYKVRMGVMADDRLWDRGNYARASKTAAQLLKAFDGNKSVAIEAICGVADWADRSLLSWTIETVMRRAYDWRAGRLTVKGRGVPEPASIRKACEVMESIKRETERVAAEAASEAFDG